MERGAPSVPGVLGYRVEVLRTERASTQDLPSAALPDELREFAEVWASLCRDGAPPSKQDIGPFSIPAHLLPNVMLWEVLEDDYLCRLAGTGLRTGSDKELSGHLLSELYGSREDEAWGEFAAVAEEGVYSFVERAVYWEDFPTSIRTRLLLPLSPGEDGRGYMVALIGPNHHYRWEPGLGVVKQDDAPDD